MHRAPRCHTAMAQLLCAALSVSAGGCAVDRAVSRLTSRNSEANATAHSVEQSIDPRASDRSAEKAVVTRTSRNGKTKPPGAPTVADADQLDRDIARRAADLAAVSQAARKAPKSTATKSASRSETPAETRKPRVIEPVAYADEPGQAVTDAAASTPADDLENLPDMPPETEASDGVAVEPDSLVKDGLENGSDGITNDIESTDQTAQSAGAAPDAAPGTTKTPKRLSDRLQIPPELPGAAVPPLRLPKYKLDDAAERDRAIEGLFPQLPKAGIDRAGSQPPMALADFEQLALGNNPLVTQAQADVDSAMGQAVQAGLYPNPMVGYQADTVGSGGTANYHGVFVEQQIKTANKLGLARSSALFSVYNSQLTLQKTRVDVLTGVRSAYYNLLTARETLKIYEALVRFTDQAYRVQVEQLKGGQAAAYEPMQLRSLSNIARTVLAQSRNRYDAASRQLAAAVGIPDLQPAELLDVADAPVPKIDYDAAVAYMLTVHPDLGSANNSTLQAQTDLQRAQVVPIPDVHFYSAIQKDFTDPTHRRTTWNMQVGVPVPIFDRNTGNIQSAQGTLIRASNERARVQNTLTQQLADAFQKYESANVLVRTYHDEIIPDQSRVYRAVYERHQQEPDVVGFGDIVVAQQTLQQGIAQYAQALGDRWAAYVEILRLLQIEDVAQLNALHGVATMPAALEGVPTPAPVE